MSADLHKYGYCTKGASVLLHANGEHLTKHQFFFYDRWPGGIYGSFAVAGARPSAPIAAAWAVVNYLGEEGYVRLARVILDTTKRLRAGIDAIPGLHVLGDPAASLVAFGSDRYDVMAIGDVMEERGWLLDRQKDPDALHMMLTPNHAKIVEPMLADLRFAVANHGASKGVEARYS
jgi:glutamate/tyrosine decarboxylase-like PLP-dependent enzyme